MLCFRRADRRGAALPDTGYVTIRVMLVRALLLVLLGGTAGHAGPVFSTLLGGSGQDYATAVASDPQGNTYVAGLTYSPDFPVTPGAAQTTFGGTCDAFIAKLDPNGRLIWATYLGGILDDWATGIAVDTAGNVWVTGYTRSANFPLVNPIQGMLDNGLSDDFDAFVAKLSNDGSQFYYSTFLGGPDDDGGVGIAADSQGNAYVAVNVNEALGFLNQQTWPDQFGIFVVKLNSIGAPLYTYFHPTGDASAIALDSATNAYVAGSTLDASGATLRLGTVLGQEAMIFKLSSDGSTKVYETDLGGSVWADATAVAVDSTGEAYVGGFTASVDFPLLHPLESTPGARPIWASTNAGATWMPLDNLPFALPLAMVADPSTPTTLYEATGDLGIFKSLDGGATWSSASTGIAGTDIEALAIDPVNTATLYAVTAPANSSTVSAVYKTVNGGAQWTLVDSAGVEDAQLAIDAQNPNIVWESNGSIRKSTDGGMTWNAVNFPGSVQTLALDPRVSGHVFAISQPVFCGFFCGGNQGPFFYSSADGGANWTQNPTLAADTPLLVDPSTNPSTVYDGLAYRSSDGGVTWTQISPPPGESVNDALAALDPSGTLYSAVAGVGNYVSHDQAQTWTAIGSFIPPWTMEIGGPSITALNPAGASGALYATIGQVATSGFVTKLSADGSSLIFSTYLRGHASMEGFPIFAAEPNDFYDQTWISAIAVDGFGNATVAGGTRATDFPAVQPVQAANGGMADAFVATIATDGSALNFSTYFGGVQDDGALGAALDSAGNVIVAGQTWSPNFPRSQPLLAPTGFGESFIAKIEMPGPPVIASVYNNASNEPGIESGSWVTIKGSNLANTFPGSTWTSADIVNGNLPTSLDGVSVTIDGKPAFVYYVSPAQINVQAPTDSATGPVSVVVNNNGTMSAPVTVQLQSVAPALYLYLGTSYAIASQLPNYTPLGNPSVVSGTVAAQPGDTIALWGTGFGPTNPPVPAGTTVTRAAATVTTPTVTVGGVLAKVISSVLSVGDAGLYQITIQLPDNTPTGSVAVIASIDGVQSQNSALLFVSAAQ
jgi:uncharacterized protein (TIGR03437 family)